MIPNKSRLPSRRYFLGLILSALTAPCIFAVVEVRHYDEVFGGLIWGIMIWAFDWLPLSLLAKKLAQASFVVSLGSTFACSVLLGVCFSIVPVLLSFGFCNPPTTGFILAGCSAALVLCLTWRIPIDQR
jgi:hypothetical protein